MVLNSKVTTRLNASDYEALDRACSLWPNVKREAIIRAILLFGLEEVQYRIIKGEKALFVAELDTLKLGFKSNGKKVKRNHTSL